MPEKPKFNKTVCLHCGVNKAVDIARAYKQGKLDGKREGAKAERERIHQDIAEMQNPYPKDVFISEKYNSWRQAWDICHKKVMELI